MYQIRTVTNDDLEAMKDVVRTSAPVDGVSVINLDGTVALRLSPDLTDMAVAEEDGAIIGFAGLSWQLRDNARSTQVLVRPDQRRRGIGRALAAYCEQRARALGCALSGSYLDTIPGAAAFAAALGTRPIGQWWFMVAELSDPRASQEQRPLAEGYAIRYARPGEDEELFAELFRDTFAQHRFLLPPPSQMIRENWSQASFDPASVAFATYQDEVVGVSAMRGRAEQRNGAIASCGHIGPVGVRAAHRQRGLARALLLDNLNYARRQGWELASLEVDSINDNAVALYRSLGFELTRRWDWWWKD
ncbi:MAG TPA: GNAT family N-acetyltransferase [Herpetosiphonaceae bacterium]